MLMNCFPPPEEAETPRRLAFSLLTSAPPPVRSASNGLWFVEVRSTPAPRRRRDPTLVLLWFNISVGAVWRHQCLLVQIMSCTSDHCLDGASRFVEGRVVACLIESHGISSAPVFGGSIWIQSSFVFGRVSTGLILPVYTSFHRRRMLF